jgi:hypothetical protein
MREIVKQNLKTLGFDKEVKLVEKGICPFCKSDKTKREDFHDELSWTEFLISGMCEECQNSIFEE